MTFGILIKFYRNRLKFGKFLENREKKDEFVNQPHSTKIVKIRALFVFKKFFSKKSKIGILVSDRAHKLSLIILITFFDLIIKRNVTVC